MGKQNFVRNPEISKNEMIVEKIEGRLSVLDLEREDLAKGMGISLSTFYNRIRDPGSFRVSELRSLYEILKVSPEDDARTKII